MIVQRRMRLLRAILLAAALAGAGGCRENSPPPTAEEKEKPEPVAADESNVPAGDVKADFTCEGKPIHPALLSALLEERSSESGYREVAALDLRTQDKLAEACPVTVAPDRWIRYRYDLAPALEGESEKGYFQYRHLGVSPAGTHVVRTARNDGGSGVFHDVVLVRFESDKVLEEGRLRSRLLMKYAGSVPLGDRDDGAVEFKGTKLTIGASRNRSRATVLEIP